MIKLNCHLSKKVPMPGAKFSSQSYGAGMEIEIADNMPAEEIRVKAKELYALLDDSVKEQIVNGSAVPEKSEAKATPKPKAKKTAKAEVSAKAETVKPKAEKAEETQPKTEAEEPAKPEKAKQEAPAEKPDGESREATAPMLNLVKKLVDERKDILDEADKDNYLSQTEYGRVKAAIDSLLAIKNPKAAPRKGKPVKETTRAAREVVIKDPEAPVTEAQLRAITKLLDQRGISGVEAEDALAVETKGEASKQIKQLLATPQPA